LVTSYALCEQREALQSMCEGAIMN